MAALLLSTAGGAAGGALFGPAGAIVGRLAGALAGNVIDHALLAGKSQRSIEGPRLADLDVMASTEGAPIPRVYGRARLAGQVIWATKLRRGGVDPQRDERQRQQGRAERHHHDHHLQLLRQSCRRRREGPIGRIGRVWADGKPLDLSGRDHALLSRRETQTPDSLIEAKQGAGNAPAYRGLGYLVFERLPLATFGNRIPQLSFEIDSAGRRARAGDPGGDGDPRGDRIRLRAATVGAAARPGRRRRRTPIVYSDVRTGRVDRRTDGALSQSRTCRLVVAWFGDDLVRRQLHARARVDNPRARPAMARPGRSPGLDRAARAGGVERRRRAGLWRHAVGRQRCCVYRRPEGAGARR